MATLKKTILEIKKLEKIYGDKTILNKISFEVFNGEFLSILGPSGCGKTTLLKVLIGIENVTSGSIISAGKDITNFHPSKRGMGIVFQNYALFPNMTVLQNVMYALKIKLKDKEKAKIQALEVIEKIGLMDHINKKPHQLSGGQQQRVAVARTLVLNPNIILFDEPMSALDAENRLTLRKVFKDVQKKFKITMIYITHDQEEAFSLSDRVMIIDNGNVVQIDTPNKIFNDPVNDYVKHFVRDHLIEKVSSIENCTKVDL